MKKLICCMLLLSHQGLLGDTTQNTLVKAFHYAVAEKLADGLKGLELGKVVLVFSPKRPVVHLVPTQGKSDTDTFLFPRSDIGTAAAKKMVKALNAVPSNRYKVSLQLTEKPTKGLKLIIKHPKGVSFRYSSYVTIKGNKGFVLSLYDQDYMDKIARRLAEPRQVVLNKKKTLSLLTADMGGAILEPLVT